MKRGGSFAERNLKWVFALPALVYFALFVAYPLFNLAYVSLSVDVKGQYVLSGLDQYANMVGLGSDPVLYQYFRAAVFNTVVFAGASVLLEFLLGLSVALLIDSGLRGMKHLASVLLVPVMIPGVVAGTIWSLIYDSNYGPLNQLLRYLGLPIVYWTTNFPLPSVIIANVWEETPIVTLILLAGLRSIPQQVHEAAQIDGLSKLQTLRRITLPLTKPSVTVAVLLAMMYAVRFFDIIYIIAGGKFDFNFPSTMVLAYLDYSLAFAYTAGASYTNFGAAISVVMIFLAMVPTYFFVRAINLSEVLGLAKTRKPGFISRLAVRGKKREGVIAVPGRSGERASAVGAARRWKFWAPPKLAGRLLLYLGGALLVLFFFFPAYWMIVTALTPEKFILTNLSRFVPSVVSLQNFADAISTYGATSYLFTSLGVALLATGITIVVAPLCAYSIARFKFGGTRLLGFVIALNAFPSVVYMIPYYLLVTRVLNLTDSWDALVMTYLVFTLPIAIWILVGYFNDIPKELDEAARIDGLSQFAIFRRIILPLVRPGLAAAAFLSLVNCWNEFLLALVLTLGPYKWQAFPYAPSAVGGQTATVLVSKFIAPTASQFGAMAAAGVLVTIPIFILTILLQRYLVKGLTLGAVRG
ncbi:MAG: ABC transporter permease subunit [Nitrososphaerales archaeon]|nr:ABC transporter permease subunit [Nitrososphaerales archaeon]